MDLYEAILQVESGGTVDEVGHLLQVWGVFSLPVSRRLEGAQFNDLGSWG